MKPWLLFLAVVLVAPAAVAQDAGTDVRQYRAFVLTEQSDNGVIAEMNVTVDDRHTWTSEGGQSMLEVLAAYTTQSGSVTNPQADYRLVWNGTAVDDCEWHVQGGTISGGRFNPTIALYCLLPSFVEPGNHTVEVERTAVTGTPVIESVTSIVLHQTESIEMDITVASAFDEFLPYLFWGGLALFFLARRAYAPALASTVMVVSSTLTTPAWSFAMGILLVVITVWIYAFARFRASKEGDV